MSKAKPAPRCECGTIKPLSAICCARCAALDGTYQGGAVISSLRTIGSSTAAQIASDLSTQYTETVYRSLRKLEAKGRVYSYCPVSGTSSLLKGQTLWMLRCPV